MSSPSPGLAPAERADAWRLASLVARLESHPHRADELRRAVGPDGVREPDRLVLTLVGVVTLARRAGCAQAEVRDVVQRFVHGALAGTHEPRFVEQMVEHCGRFAEAAAALCGRPRGPRAPAPALLA